MNLQSPRTFPCPGRLFFNFFSTRTFQFWDADRFARRKTQIFSFFSEISVSQHPKNLNANYAKRRKTRTFYWLTLRKIFLRWPRRGQMIIDFSKPSIQPRWGVIVCEIHIIPSGFEPDHVTFYNPAIPSGLNCVRWVLSFEKAAANKPFCSPISSKILPKSTLCNSS